jgi:uncharacterized protein (DUF983 family)
MKPQLEPCPHCQHPVHVSADVCTSCGVNLRRMRNNKFVGVFVAVVAGLLVLFFILMKIEELMK